MFNKTITTAHSEDGWMQRPLKQLSRRTLQTAHPHWSDSELNQVMLMLDLKQDNPCGDLGVILA